MTRRKQLSQPYDQPASNSETGATATAGHLFKLIRDLGPLSASELARQTGLAKSTVSVNLDRLLESGLVREEEKPGSKRKNLKVAENAGYVAGVDIGQTHLAVGLCDLEAAAVSFYRTPINLVQEAPERLLAQVADLIDEQIVHTGRNRADLFGIGVGVPGPVDFLRGIPVSPPVMPGWDRFPMASFLAGRFSCPVFVDNDVNVMALGERDRGVAHETENFLFIKVGSGIGGGLVVHGEIYRGAKGAAGDIGHIGLDGDETPCPCGNKGCLEVVAGAEAVLRKANAAARSGQSPFLSESLSGGRSLDITSLAVGASAGDEVCVRLMMDSGKAVGTVLAKLVNFFNPSMIVLGGRSANWGERYIASIREAIYRRSTPLATADLVIKKSLLGEECGVIGAAVLALDEILSRRNVSRIVGGTTNAKKT